MRARRGYRGLGPAIVKKTTKRDRECRVCEAKPGHKCRDLRSREDRTIYLDTDHRAR
jgi:hypothetical protein